MYTLRFFAVNADGSREYVTEGEFANTDEALDRLDNIGSRWIFYPHAQILEYGKVFEEFICEEAL